MKTLTDLQSIYLQKICFLLFLQLVVLVSVVSAVHKFFPKQKCLFTCRFWLDLVLYLGICIGLIFVSHNTRLNLVVRYIAFFGFSVLLSYIMALQYNQVAMSNRNEKKTAEKFFKALWIVISIFIINLILLPFTLKYMGFIYTISISLFICLIGLIVWGLFVGKDFLAWVTVSLLVFLGLFLTDLNILVNQCKKQCDPLTGASLLYVDLINLLQQIFILLNAERR